MGSYDIELEIGTLYRLQKVIRGITLLYPGLPFVLHLLGSDLFTQEPKALEPSQLQWPPS